MAFFTSFVSFDAKKAIVVAGNNNIDVGLGTATTRLFGYNGRTSGGC